MRAQRSGEAEAFLEDKFPSVLKRQWRNLLYVGRLHGADNLGVEKTLLESLTVKVKSPHV